MIYRKDDLPPPEIIIIVPKRHESISISDILKNLYPIYAARLAPTINIFLRLFSYSECENGHGSTKSSWCCCLLSKWKFCRDLFFVDVVLIVCRFICG